MRDWRPSHAASIQWCVYLLVQGWGARMYGEQSLSQSFLGFWPHCTYLLPTTLVIPSHWPIQIRSRQTQIFSFRHCCFDCISAFTVYRHPVVTPSVLRRLINCVIVIIIIIIIIVIAVTITMPNPGPHPDARHAPILTARFGGQPCQCCSRFLVLAHPSLELRIRLVIENLRWHSQITT